MSHVAGRSETLREDNHDQVADRFVGTLAAAGLKGLGGIGLNACASRQGSDRLSNSPASEGNSEHIYLGYE